MQMCKFHFQSKMGAKILNTGFPALSQCVLHDYYCIKTNAIACNENGELSNKQNSFVIKQTTKRHNLLVNLNLSKLEAKHNGSYHCLITSYKTTNMAAY